MSTIQVKGSYRMAQDFVEKGVSICNDNTNNQILKQYYQYLISIGNTKNTIILKLMYIYTFVRYLQVNKKTLKKLSKNDIYDYINECSRLNWGMIYQNSNKFQIKCFFNWSFQNGFTRISGDMVLPRIIWHRNTDIKTYYTQEEMVKLLNAIDIKTNQGKEDYLIISLICYLGLRKSDVINLKLSNINFDNNTISIIQCKTNKELLLPLIDKVKYPLLDYLKNVRPNDAELDYIFITTEKPYRHHIELKTHNHKLKKYLIKAGIDINGRKHGFHSLRHSFSTSLLKENTSLYSISTILGHQDIETTMSYLDIDISKLKELALEVPYVK